MADDGTATRGKQGTTAFAEIRDIVFVAAIFLYFTGFVFRRGYFEAFGVPTTTQETDLFVLPIYAYSVILYAWWGIAVAVVVATAAYAALRYGVRGRHRRCVRLFARRRYAAALGIAAFPLLWWAAEATAVHERSDFVDKLKSPAYSVTLALEDAQVDSGDFTGTALRSAQFSHQLHLLAMTESTMFVALLRPGDAGSPGDVLVYGVPRDKVRRFDVEITQ